MTVYMSVIQLNHKICRLCNELATICCEVNAMEWRRENVIYSGSMLSMVSIAPLNIYSQKKTADFRVL